jgi:hypothetical protein
MSYGIFEGLSLRWQGFERSSAVVAAISVSFSALLFLIQLINRACISNDPEGFLKRRPEWRGCFTLIKESTATITTMVMAVVVTEKLIYKFPDVFLLQPE